MASLTVVSGGNPQETRGFGTVEASDPGSRPTGQRKALLIGINDYKERPLRTPVGDVRALGEVLKEEYGFSDVEYLLNEQATGQAIRSKLESYKTLTTADDDLLVYFAGHGAFVNPEGYWVPQDGVAGSQSTWLPNENIRQLIALSPARQILIISDSCFSGSLTRAPGDSKLPAALEEYLKQLRRHPSREIISSGGFEEVADGGYRGHSIFAFHLLEVLKGSEPLPAAIIHSSLVGPLMKDQYTPQTPGLGVFDRGVHNNRGSFVLSRTKSAETPSTVIQKGVPLGWRLPPGVEAEDQGEEKYVYFKRTGNDASRMMMVLPGAFPYGSMSNRAIISTPFLIDEHEVTVGRFRHFVRERRPTDLATWNDPKHMREGQAVVGVSLRTALEFAAWAGKVIPDEIHWQYAAAWGPGPEFAEHRAYPWGGTFDDVAPPPCLYPPEVDSLKKDRSAWGVLGMGSGVREWCVLPIESRHSETSTTDRQWSRRDFGVLRGATQVFTGRRDLRSLSTSDREVAPAAEYTSRDVGFRCIMFLERSSVLDRVERQ
jgi:hypothetical protein